MLMSECQSTPMGELPWHYLDGTHTCRCGKVEMADKAENMVALQAYRG